MGSSRAGHPKRHGGGRQAGRRSHGSLTSGARACGAPPAWRRAAAAGQPGRRTGCGRAQRGMAAALHLPLRARVRVCVRAGQRPRQPEREARLCWRRRPGPAFKAAGGLGRPLARSHPGPSRPIPGRRSASRGPGRGARRRSLRAGLRSPPRAASRAGAGADCRGWRRRDRAPAGCEWRWPCSPRASGREMPSPEQGDAFPGTPGCCPTALAACRTPTAASLQWKRTLRRFWAKNTQHGRKPNQTKTSKTLKTQRQQQPTQEKYRNRNLVSAL